ncbi:MAG: DUF4412 domain-containing protein [Bacteroidota bacterium]
MQELTAWEHIRRGRLGAVVLWGLLLAVPGGAGERFQGVVETDNSSLDEGGTMLRYRMVIRVGKDRLRVEAFPPGEAARTAVIYRSDRNLMWVLDLRRRTYTEDVLRIPEERDDAPPAEAYSIRRTGQRKRILGYACEQVLLTRDDIRCEVWATSSLRDVGDAVALILPEEGGESSGGWDRELKDLGMYSVRATVRLGGIVVESQELVGLRRGAQSPGSFEIPQGYRKEDPDRLPEDPAGPDSSPRIPAPKRDRGTGREWEGSPR